MKTLESQVSKKGFFQDSPSRERMDAIFFAAPQTLYTIAFGMAYCLAKNGFASETNTAFDYAALNFSKNLAGALAAISLAKSCFYWRRSIRP